jgi:hypothetical protein
MLDTNILKTKRVCIIGWILHMLVNEKKMSLVASCEIKAHDIKILLKMCYLRNEKNVNP